MLGTSGNLSILLEREPLRFLVTASGKDKSRLTVKDLVLVEEGRAEPGAPRPSAEAAIHEGLYRNLPAGAVYHVHTVAGAVVSSLYAAENRVCFRGLEMLKGLDIWDLEATVEIPILPNLPDIPALARLAARSARPEVPGFLIHNHGLYAWGASPFEAKRHVEIFEYLYELELTRRRLG